MIMNGKYILTAVASATLLLLCSCQRELDTDQNGINTPVAEAGEAVEFTAWTTQMDNGAPGTKTYLDNLFIKWDSVNDRISVFSTGGANTECSITSLENDGTKAIFSGSVPASDSYLAVYPYNSEFTGDPSTGTVTAVIPTEQLIPSGMNVAPQSMVSVAMANQANEFTFANVFGVMQLTISADDITSVTVEGNTEAKLSGKVTIAENSGNPTITNITGQGVAHVTIKPQGGGAFAPGTYYAIMLPNALSDGFKVIFTKSDGTVGARSWSNSQGGIVRNSGIDIGSTAPTKWRNALVAREVANTATSSTLTFEWSENDFNDAAADLARDYRFALYSDPGCSDLVLAWNTPKTNTYTHSETSFDIFHASTPRFIFSGLDPDTDYYFKVYDAGYKTVSGIVHAKTSPFTPVTLPSTAAAGDTILAEDFSEFIWSGDLAGRAAGFSNVNISTSTFVKPSGNLSYDSSASQNEYLVPFTSDHGVPKSLTVGGAASRLADWGVLRQGGSSDCWYSRPGYVKLGTTSNFGHLLTPVLSCIPSGKTATVEVSFRAVDYVAESGNADGSSGQVAVYRGGVANTNVHMIIDKNTGEQKDTKLYDLGTSWQSYTFTLTDVRNTDRILFGIDNDKRGTYPRMNIDDITVTIVSIEDIPVVVTGPDFSYTWFTKAESWYSANGYFLDGVDGFNTKGWLKSDDGNGLLEPVLTKAPTSNCNVNTYETWGQPDLCFLCYGLGNTSAWRFSVPVPSHPAGKCKIHFNISASAKGPKVWLLQYSTDGSTWTDINSKVTTITASEFPSGSEYTSDTDFTNTFMLDTSPANSRLEVEEVFDLPAAEAAGTLYIQAKVNARASCDLSKKITAGNGGTSRIGRYASIEFPVEQQ